MKDLLKRLLCIVLALTMVVCLVACGSSEDEDEDEEEETAEEGGKKSNKKETEEETTEEPEEEDSLVGEWEATIDLSDYLSDMLYAELDMELDVEDFAIVMTLVFDEDGTYEAELDISKLEGAMENLIDELWDVMMEMTAEEAGMSVEEVEALMEEQGVTKDALMAEMDFEGLFEEAFEDFDDKGKWVLDGDELYMAKKNPEDTDPVEIEFDGDEFSIVDGPFLGDGVDEDMLEYVLPIVFERV